jgi:cytochrome c biogenesis protein CcmG/thiol:disulfide interchange protein DsbE
MSTGFYATRVDACQSSPPSVHLTNATDARLAGGRRLFVVLPVAIFSALAVVLGWGLTQEARVIPSALIGRPVPDFALPSVEGRNPGLSSADLKGKVSLVNVFASWCMACRLEHPVFMELNRTGLVPIHGINYKDRPQDVAKWLNTLGDPYTRSGADRDGRVSIDWGVYGVPETYVIDSQGRIAFKQVGPVTPDVFRDKIGPLIEKLRD